MFFLFSLTLYVNILQGAVPFSHDQQVPILPELPSPTENRVPNHYGRRIALPHDISLKSAMAFAVLANHGEGVTWDTEEKIGKTHQRAHKLIRHGQETNQLSLFSKKNNEHLAIHKALAIQLAQLDIWGVDDEGRLDPRLTTLADFFIENPQTHKIVPFDEGELQVVPEPGHSLRCKLFRTN